MELDTQLAKTDNILNERMQVEAMLTLKKQELAEMDLYKEIKELELKHNQLKKQYEEECDTIKNAMIDVGLKEFKTIDGRKLLLKKSPGSVKVIEEDKIPEAMYIEKTTKSLDKKTILKLLREGQVISGVELGYTYSLQIKQD